jgi:hypothetical protein
MKHFFSLPIIATIVAVLFPTILGPRHLCHLQSTIIEVLLLTLTLSSCLWWTARAKTLAKAWLRTGLAFIFAVMVQVIYVNWLHSDFFPHFLLSREAKEREMMFYNFEKMEGNSQLHMKE